MPTFDEIEKNESLFTMLKGEPGTRKSTCALSYPTPQYWISTDRKMEALKLPIKKWGINKKDIHSDDYIDWTSPRKKLEEFQINCPFKTIIVDSVTSLGDNINRETIKQKTGTSDKGKKVGNIYVPGIEEYNAEASAFQELIAILKDIHKFHKVNIILIAHVVGQRKQDNTNTLTHHSRVIITGGDKISGKIAAYMTEVYHFNVEPNIDVTKDGSYSLYTTHTGNDYARTSLELPQKLTFDDKPLYDTFLKPAIEKMKDNPVIITGF